MGQRSRGSKYDDEEWSSDNEAESGRDRKQRASRYNDSESESDSEPPSYSEEEDDDDCAPIDSRSRQQAKRHQSLTGRDKTILILGVTLIICASIIGVYSIYQYVDQPESAPASSPTTTVTVTGPGEPGSKSTGGSPSDASGTGAGSKAVTPTSDGNGASSGALHTTFPGISKNGIGIGLLPDYKDQDLSKCNEGLNVKMSFYGWYAQLPESGEWDGSQILGSVLEDVKRTGAIFQPAVMPNQKNWKGLSASDNYQALAIAKVLKQYTDQGIEVWLRFAHEVNWYQVDGTYSGGVKEFKEAWAAVYNAVKDNELIRMFYTPNVAASLDDYVRYFPDDLESVHYIGIDYYPRSSAESFLEHVKPFYDKYCKDGKIKFAMGETGTAWVANIEEKLAWMDQMTNEETAKALPHYVGTCWFNYDKEEAFKLWKAGEDSDNAKSKTWFATGTDASGAKMGNA